MLADSHGSVWHSGLLLDGSSNTVLTMEESTAEERAVDARVRAAIAARGRLKTLWGHTLFHIDDLPFSEDLADMPDTFTPARKTIEAKCLVRALLPSPRTGDLGSLPAALAASAADALWDKIPLADNVREQGFPEDHPLAALHFKVCTDTEHCSALLCALSCCAPALAAAKNHKQLLVCPCRVLNCFTGTPGKLSHVLQDRSVACV
jgi:hypothetical protein